MNIIKFKDSIRPDDTLFNNYLKGKYAYWVRMRYVVPFEVITPEEYISAEIDTAALKPFEGKYRDMFADKALSAWVDELETENINDIQSYIRSNKYATDPEITLADVKKFRTWLAEQLLLMDQTASGRQKYEFYNEEFTHVLEYYASGMYNDVVKWLTKYGQDALMLNNVKANCGCVPTINEFTLSNLGNINNIIKPGCGCNSSNLDFNLQSMNLCDPVLVYRKAIKAKMVEYFGDMNFWMQMTPAFLIEFKTYIDNIIHIYNVCVLYFCSCGH